VKHVVTDNGREYCGRSPHHPFELFLTISHIEHRRTQVGSPQTNGFCERFNRTVRKEFFLVAFRKTLYAPSTICRTTWTAFHGYPFGHSNVGPSSGRRRS
jgi:transposase InsO family protein